MDSAGSCKALGIVKSTSPTILLLVLVVGMMACQDENISRPAYPTADMTRVLAPSPTPHPTTTPEPNPTACIPSGAVVPVQVEDISMFFYCGISPAQYDLAMEFIRYGLEDLPSDIELKAEAHIFVDLNEGAMIQYRWKRSHGSDITYEEVLQDWDTHEGMASKGAMFADFGRGPVKADVYRFVKGGVILHEMHHLLQAELTASSHYPPDWFEEGGADYFADQKLLELGAPPIVMGIDSGGCDFSLSRLEDRRVAPDEHCIYEEGEKAVALLIRQYGREKYFLYFRSLGTGRSLRRAFLETFGLELEDFYQGFDAYRNSDYDVIPTSIIPSNAATP